MDAGEDIDLNRLSFLEIDDRKDAIRLASLKAGLDMRHYIRDILSFARLAAAFKGSAFRPLCVMSTTYTASSARGM